jgi:predicted metal-dependent phosphotriesterase family hydrolase
MKKYLSTFDQMKISDGLTVYNDSGEIDQKVKEILALAKDYDVAVASGHLSAEEAVALGQEAKKMGLKKFVFGHPDSKSVGGEIDHIKAIAEMGFYVEFVFLGLLPAFQRISIQEVCRRIKEIGANHSILTTDAFFEWTPPMSEMMRMFIGTLLEQGITKSEIEMMVRKNPGELLNV